jgi:hypothetical protein
MADEELRLRAVFEDRMGPALKTSIEKIKAFAQEGAKAGADGEKSVKKHEEAFAKLRDRLKETVNLSRDEFLPGLEKSVLGMSAATTGVGALATGFGLAVAAARNFGTEMLSMQQASRETGLTPAQLRTWQNFGELAGTTAEAMKQGAASFNNMIEQMQRRPDIFRQMFTGIDTAGLAPLRDFMLSIANLPRNEQLQQVMNFISQIRDVGQQKQALNLLGIPYVDLQHYVEELARAHTTVTDLGKATEDMGAEAGRRWIELGQKFQDLSIVIGAKFSPALSEATQELLDFITANQGAWSADADTWFADATKSGKEFATMIKGVVDNLNAIIQWEATMPTLFPKGAVEDQLKKIGPAFHEMLQGGTDRSPLPPGVLQPGQHPAIQGAPPPGLFHPASFIVGGGEEGGAGLSKGTSDMINIIAQGTRRGVYDGLMDFSQTVTAAGGAGGVTPISFGGQPGAGAGGRPGAPGRSAPGVGGAPGGGGGVGASSGSFMDALARIESSNRNVYSTTDPDVAGPGTRSQGYFQINTPTWRDFAARAGIDLAKYPNAMSAPRDIQATVASVIPLARFGPRTRRMLEAQFGFGEGQKGNTIGSFAARFGGHIRDAAAAGAPAARAAGAPAPGHSKIGGSDPIDRNFLERWRNTPPPEPHRYLNPYGNKPQEASLLRMSQQANAGVSKVQGEAKLSIELAGGLRPRRGVENDGSLFKEIKISRGSIPYASTET